MQVISNTANLKMVDGEPLEAAITRYAKHRNILNTLDYAVTNSGIDADSDFEERVDSAYNRTKRAQETETWMLLEFCDCGCLQVGSPCICEMDYRHALLALFAYCSEIIGLVVECT